MSPRDFSAVMVVSNCCPIPLQLQADNNADAQLELFDPYAEDGLTFGEWLEALPLDPSEVRR